MGRPTSGSTRGRQAAATDAVPLQRVPHASRSGRLIPQPLWTPRAETSFAAASAGLRHRVVRVVRTALRRYGRQVDWYDGKKTVQGLKENVYELRATHAHRVLVQEHQDTLVIVELGDHDVVSRYVSRPGPQRRADLAAATEAPAAFHPATEVPLFVNIDDLVEPSYDAELDSGWLTFLSEEQALVAHELARSIAGRRRQDDTFVAYLRGGAGTGKTAIVLNLALRMIDAGIPVRLECSTALAKHLTQHTKVNVRQLQHELTRGGVLLVDDPSSPGATQIAVSRAHDAGARAVVVGYDPLQWRDKRLRQAMATLPTPDFDHRLSTCYRQSSSLAQQAIEMVAAVHDRSSWRVDPKLIAEERLLLKELEAEYLAGLRFVKPGGRVRVVEPGEVNSVFRREVEALRTRWDRWTDMPCLLVLEDRDHGVQLTKGARGDLKGIGRQTHKLQDVGSYRGLDFQATWIFMSKDFYDRIQEGKPGLGTAEWESLRDLHVAFTRAKDETLLFLV